MIALFGHGYVGSAIARRFLRDGIPFLWRSHVDEMPPAEMYVNAAGYTGVPNVDGCEDHRRETVEGSIDWPLRLARTGVPTVHVSSGCLYSGLGGFTENDSPNFRGSWYSIVKQVEEEVLRPSMDRSYILRIRMPFGRDDHPRNLLTKLRGYETLLDGTNSVSCIDDVARVVAYFVLVHPDPGVYNVCNPGTVSTRTIAKMLGLSKPFFGPGEFRGAAGRSECSLCVDKLMKVFPLDDVYKAIRGCV